MSKCQHCQDEISGRRKQCPACASIKNDAHRYGTYGEVVEAFEAARRRRLVGQDVRDFVLGKKAAATKANCDAADKRRADRERANELWRARRAGYCPACGQYNYQHDFMCELGIPG